MKYRDIAMDVLTMTTTMRQACDCKDWSCGLPPCDGCGEDHGGHKVGDKNLCRDCDLEFVFEHMTCATCGKLRTRSDGVSGELAAYLFGAEHRCLCETFVSKRPIP